MKTFTSKDGEIQFWLQKYAKGLQEQQNYTRRVLLAPLRACFEFFPRMVFLDTTEGSQEVSELFIVVPRISETLHRKAAHIFFFTLMNWFVLSEGGGICQGMEAAAIQLSTKRVNLGVKK